MLKSVLGLLIAVKQVALVLLFLLLRRNEQQNGKKETQPSLIVVGCAAVMVYCRVVVRS
jgi:hypothetical protein